jgi:hypothetical protein
MNMPTWTAAGNGDWTNAANWSGGVPDSLDAVATFNNATNGGFQQIGILEGSTIDLAVLNVNLSGTTDLAIGGSLNDTGSGFGVLHFDGGQNIGYGTVNINTTVGGGEFEISGFGGLRVDLGNSYTDFNVVNAGTTARINAQIVGSGTMVKSGNGTLLLGSVNSTWNGGIAITSGTVQATTTAALGTGSVTFSGGGILRTSGSTSNLMFLQSGSATLQAPTATTLTLTGSLDHDSNGTFVLGGGVANGTISMSLGASAVNGSSSFNLAGGTVRLDNAYSAYNLFRGQTTGTNAIASGAILDTRGFDTQIANLDLNGGTIRTSSGALDLTIADNTAGIISQSGTIEGTAGTDTIVVNVNAGFSFTGVTFSNWTAGTDTISIYGNLANNGITGSAQREFIDGGDGNDTIYGNGGIDYLSGGNGNDILIVSSANGGSSVHGGAGTDTLRIINGAVGLSNLSGFEALELIGGASFQLGNAYFNSAFALGSTIAGNGTLIVDLGFNDSFSGSNMVVQAGSTINATINGSDSNIGADIIKGISGATNTIYGNAGNDQIRGGGLADTINGGDGDDKLGGAGGADILFGGLGADTFRYPTAASSGVGANADHIMDFVSGTDRLSFLALDVDPVTPGHQALSYIGNTAFHATGAAEIRWQTAGADLRVDVDLDGNGTTDMQIFLSGLGGGTLTSGDFLL